MIKKFIPIIFVLFLFPLLFPNSARAQSCISSTGLCDSTPNNPYVCLTESGGYQCCPTSGCNSSGAVMELVGCAPGSCSGEMCQIIANNISTDDSQISLSYLAILKRCVDMNQFLNVALSWAVLLGGLGVMIRLGIGAIQYATSQGNPAKLEDARATLTWAILGMLLLGIAFLILRLGDQFIPIDWGWDFWLGVGG